MNRKERIMALIAEAALLEQQPFVADEAALLRAGREPASLAIRILTVAGGIFGSIAFAVALFISGITESAGSLWALCLLSLGGAIWLNFRSGQIIYDTFTICLFLLGLVFLSAALTVTNDAISERSLLHGVALTSALVGMLARRPVMIFTAFLIINASLFTLMALQENMFLLPWHLSILSVLLTFICLYEARLIVTSRLLLRWLRPLRAGLVFSLTGGLLLYAYRGWIYMPAPAFVPVLFLTLMTCICWVLFRLFPILNIHKPRQRLLLTSLFLLLLSPAYLYPALAGAFLILLLGFRNNYRLGFAVGVLFFIYALSRFYYDLHTTLLVKSLFLMGSGVLFLILYFSTQKKLRDEKTV